MGLSQNHKGEIMAKKHDIKVTKTRTVGELRQEYSDNLQVIMNMKAPRFLKDKALRDMLNVRAVLYEKDLVITVTIGVEKK